MPKIVIVDDDHAVNDHLKKLLSFVENAEIFQAFDRKSAEQIIADRQPNLVVLDIDLGSAPTEKYGGFQILATLNGKKTVALVVSGVPQDNLPDVAISLQAFDFIAKPINDSSFIHKVKHALEFYNRSAAESVQEEWPSDLTVDKKRHLGLNWKGRPVRLSITHLRLVYCLLEKPGKVVYKERLAEQLDISNSISAVATHISEVRQRFIDVDPQFDGIDNEPGKGYVWKIKN